MIHTEYMTKHRDLITGIFRENRERYFTSGEIIARVKDGTGEATVYRILKKLAAEGVIEKKINDTAAGTGAVYKYIEPDACGCRFHLRCVNCGLVIHMDCREMKAAENHIKKAHGFEPLDKATFIEGICEKCRK